MHRFVSVVVCSVLLASASSFAELRASKRGWLVAESYWEAFGRGATLEEIRHWEGRNDWKDKAALIELHRNFIRGNASAAEEVVRNSYRNLFNRNPLPGERDFWLPYARKGVLWSEITQHHRAHIAREAAAKGLNTTREASKLKSNTTLMARLRQKGYDVAPNGDIIRMVAAGGGNMVAAGGGNMVAAGGGNVAVPVGMYLVGNNGNSLIGLDGGSLLGNDGGSFRPRQ